ncbi:MAG: TonB-dependent receptor, partial [Lentimicrobiaceae bacterium]|nr:TonB-dependent receptor [Lentimicrobiaceae bacterium]
ITIRSSGGVGSASRISLRGLEGKRIGFFIDETPISDYSDFVDLNDIPIDMIDRIEVYKGVVPAKFGASAMGGAVNIVMREYPERYADISYKHASFNTNELQTVIKRNFIEQGIVLGIGGGYTYADNDYTMESPYIKGLKIKRNHDKFKKILTGGSIKARKWWFDEVEIEPAFINIYRQIQGIETDIREANISSRVYLLNNILKKDDFLIEGLDLDVSTSAGYTQYQLVDTAKAWYDWDGVAYPTISLYGGELGNRFPSFSNNKKIVAVNKFNLEYTINKKHSLSINSFFTLANGYPSDTLKEISLGKKIDFNSNMVSWVGGITHNFRTDNDKFLNSLTVRYYLYTMQTKHQNFYVSSPPEDINLNKSNFGVSDALRYRFTPDLLGKLSAGYDVRIPSETELLGDGYSIAPSERLMPERNRSVNVGLLYDLTGKQSSNLQLEVSGFYMHLNDMIRFVKGMLGAQYQNFGEMRTLGVEFEAKADIFSFLYGYGNVTFQDLRDVRQYEENSSIPNPTKNKRMPNIPYFMANAGLEFHKENLFGGKEQNTRVFADMAFVEEYFYDFELTENSKRRLPRSLAFDIGFEHSFMNQRLFLSGKINNITNAKILSEFNRPLPGRNLGVKLRYVFR